MIGVLIAMLSALSSPQTKPALPNYFPSSMIVDSKPCPEGDLSSVGTVSDFEKDWYARQLAAADEPPLYGATADGSSLRFTWLRTFHKPIVVRLSGLETDTPRLIAKEMTGHGGYDPGKVGRIVKRFLTTEEADAIRALIARNRVLTEPVDACRFGNDGAEWLIESNGRTGYRFVKEWSPERGAMRDTGLALLKLTGWKINPIY